MTGDPSTETRRDAVGLSTSAQLRQTQLEAGELTALLLQAREEVTGLAETLSIFDSALRDARRSLAASQADLTHVEQQLANAEAERLVAEARLHDALADIDALTLVKTELTAAQQAEPCAWRDLAVTAMQEHDLARAQLDDAIAEFLAIRRWAVADGPRCRCASCERPIVRGQAYQPLADAKGYFAHVFCPIEEER